jgi:hypothetical protein
MVGLFLNGVQTVFRMKLDFVSHSKDGAGDGGRTRDVQLGNVDAD